MGNVDAKTIAWIFLAISFWDKSPVSRREISLSADAINHLVPLESELDLAIRFLTQQGLVESKGTLIAITEAGRAILEPAHKDAANVFAVWKTLEASISSLNAA